jgi:hypothetical protein
MPALRLSYPTCLFSLSQKLYLSVGAGDIIDPYLNWFGTFDLGNHHRHSVPASREI